MAGLDERYVAKARKLVFEKFPEMAGAKPSVSKGGGPGQEPRGRGKRGGSSANAPGGQRGGRPETQGCGTGRTTRYVVTFESDVPLPGGGKMKRTVRVTMDEAGEILKLASSK
ncbi:MAG: hypothetical protein PVG25_08015 [Anaerolineae bacterium]|jgi:hypothetical protein